MFILFDIFIVTLYISFVFYASFSKISFNFVLLCTSSLSSIVFYRQLQIITLFVHFSLYVLNMNIQTFFKTRTIFFFIFSSLSIFGLVFDLSAIRKPYYAELLQLFLFHTIIILNSSSPSDFIYNLSISSFCCRLLEWGKYNIFDQMIGCIFGAIHVYKLTNLHILIIMNEL